MLYEISEALLVQHGIKTGENESMVIMYHVVPSLVFLVRRCGNRSKIKRGGSCDVFDRTADILATLGVIPLTRSPSHIAVWICL